MNVLKKLAWTLVILWMGLIFAFSAQDGTKSLEVSTNFTLKAIELNPETKDLSKEEQVLLMKYKNSLMRKIAHAMIYSVLGGLCMLALSLGSERLLKESWKWALVICLFYAISDEVHQMFVPGRSALVKDVGIDLGGAVLGASLAWGVIVLITENIHGFKQIFRYKKQRIS